MLSKLWKAVLKMFGYTEWRKVRKVRGYNHRSK